MILNGWFTVPSPPGDIKAAMSDHNKILVSWLPPNQKNGELTDYTLYMGIVENGKEVSLKLQIFISSKNRMIFKLFYSQ